MTLAPLTSLGLVSSHTNLLATGQRRYAIKRSRGTPCMPAAKSAPARHFHNHILPARPSPSSFQPPPIPPAQIRPRLISTLQKIQQCLPRQSSPANVVIHQQKLFHLRMVKSSRRPDLLLGKTSRLRRRIRIKRRTLHLSPARPESRADHFMRIRLARNRIGTRPFRSAPSRKSRHAQIEAAPEKMYRTIFAHEPGAKFLKNVAAQNQYPPQALRIFAIVRRMLRV